MARTGAWVFVAFRAPNLVSGATWTAPFLCTRIFLPLKRPKRALGYASSIGASAVFPSRFPPGGALTLPARFRGVNTHVRASHVSVVSFCTPVWCYGTRDDFVVAGARPIASALAPAPDLAV